MRCETATLDEVTARLWFDGAAEEFAQHCAQGFKEGEILGIMKSDGIGPFPKAQTMLVRFEIDEAPRSIFEIIQTKDSGVRERAFAAMLQLAKFDLATIEAAFKG